MWLMVLGFFCWLILFKLGSGRIIPGVGGGTTKISQPAAPAPAPPPPSPAQQATEIEAARQQIDPQSAQRAYDILANQQYGLEPTTRLYEQTRQNVFPNETGVRNQLADNILQNLMSPTGISPDQQTAINYRRGEAQTNLQKALRERANLGGGLYGGRAITEEQNAVSDLQRAFVEDDLGREERARLNAIQAAIPFLQILYPDVGISAPNFQSAVQDPNQYSNALLTARGQNIGQSTSIYQGQLQAAIAQQQAQAQMQSALYQGIGSAVGGGLTGGLGAGGAFTKAGRG